MATRICCNWRCLSQGWAPGSTKEELDNLLEMGSMGAARAIGLAEDHGVGVGKRADLVIFEAKSGHEAIITQARKLWVIKGGRVVARNGELLVRSAV